VDVKTLMISLLLVNALLGFFMLITMRAHKVYPGYNLWAYSTTLVFFVYVLLVLRGIIPDYLSIVISNTIVGVVGSMRIAALRKFFGMSPLKHLWMIPLSVFLLFTYFFIFDNIAARLTIISLVMVLICFYNSYIFFLNRNNGSKLLHIMFICVCFLVSFLIIFRWQSLFFTDHKMNMVPTTANTLFYLFSIVTDIFWATLFYAMNSSRLSKDLGDANISLAESNAVKDKFFSIISHDLRGPVGNISRYLNQIIGNYPKYKEEKVLSTLNRISETADKTYSLLDDLLLWAKIQSDGISPKTETVELNPFIKNIIKLMGPAALLKKILLTNEIPEDIIITSDKNMLTSILLNLISNAVKFSYEWGRITVSARHENSLIRITVSDNGTGFSQNYIESLTDNGKIITEKGTWDEAGTGFGLVICDEFIRCLGSEMRITSEAGVGSEFSFTLQPALKVL